MKRSTLFAIIASAAWLAGPTGAGAVSSVGAGEIAEAKPGQILRIHPQEGGAVGNAKAYRIIYRSTDIKGEPIAVSGAIIFPDGDRPAGQRNVVAWAHPTTGVVGKCAPTLLPDLSGTIAGIEEMLDRGFVIAATDYIGLGGNGIHPYLIGASEARAVLDIVRASRQLPDAAAGKRFAVWGHSQGGHAALFTGELAKSYAPELHLVGVAAAAPATYLGELFRADTGTVAGNTLTAMVLLSWSKVFDIALDNVIEPGVHSTFEAVARSCIERITELLDLQEVEAPLQRRFLKVDPTGIEPWRSIMDDNTPGQATAAAPVLLLQGTADELVRPEITRRFANHLCAQGMVVDMVWLEGVSHSFAGYRGADAAVRWMADRFSGKPAPNGCGSAR